jgi:T-complex protein 1 subunit theta
MNFNSARGLSGMLKAGHTHYDNNLDVTTLRNIEAAKNLSNIIRSSLGPQGMNKLVITHLEKIIVTSDAATIVKELEIVHPAAKMVSMASDAQDSECGDGTNLTVSFAGELLSQTEELLRMGLHTSEIIAGYQKAYDKLNEIMPTLCASVRPCTDPKNEVELTRVLAPVIMAKQCGLEDVLAPLVAQACIAVMQKTPVGSGVTLSPDSVRSVKILGGGVSQSVCLRGMVVPRAPDTTFTIGAGQNKIENAKVVVFGCGFEASQTEAKGTVLMKTAEDLKGYNKTEETKMEEIVKSIKESGVDVVVAGGSVSEMGLHFLNKYELVCVKIGSKWELRRLCKAVNATALVRLGPPMADEVGECDCLSVKEIGGKHVTVFEQSSTKSQQECKIATIVLRASTSSVLADLERAVEDGVHAVKTACEDGRLVAGGGAAEMALRLALSNYGDTCPGLDQYAIRAFAKALEFVPRTLSENSGQDAQTVLATLAAAHATQKSTMGVDIFAQDYNATSKSSGGIRDVLVPSEHGDNPEIVDLYASKVSALRLATDAALTILRVDQIIMSKQAGGGMPMSGMNGN